MNPPIRGESDRISLLQAVREGHIDYLATDHAPHTKEEKLKGMSGLPGLDTYGAFVTWLIVDQKIDPKIIAKITTESPGQFFNQFMSSIKSKSEIFSKWGLGFGFFTQGFSASFTILDLKSPIKIEEKNLMTKALWSPFLGVTFPGRVKDLYLAGKRV